MNPLFQQMTNGQPSNIAQQFQRFRQTFKGNPQEQIQRLLNSGRVSQDQYNRAVQVARQLQQMLGIK